MGAEAELDQGAGIGRELGLPAMIGLEFLHGGFSGRVPLTGGWTGQIVLANQGVLNLFGALRLYATLAGDKVVFSGSLVVEDMASRRSTMSPRGKSG